MGSGYSLFRLEGHELVVAIASRMPGAEELVAVVAFESIGRRTELEEGRLVDGHHWRIDGARVLAATRPGPVVP